MAKVQGLHGLSFIKQVLDTLTCSKTDLTDHSADYISFRLGSLGPLWYLWKLSSAHVYVSSVANFITAYKESPIFEYVVCSLFPKAFFNVY